MDLPLVQMDLGDQVLEATFILHNKDCGNLHGVYDNENVLDTCQLLGGTSSKRQAQAKEKPLHTYSHDGDVLYE